MEKEMKIKSEPGRDEVTIISTGVILEGKLQSSGDVRVDGTIKGDIQAEGNITIGEHGVVNGEVNGGNVTIGGKIYGGVKAKEKLVLESKSVLKGDLNTKILIIEAGAKFEGSSHMNSGEVNLKPAASVAG
jgi:cytoskeletal protein CcmA (bactofilin family)